jgi:FixJ family two-component response regulator
MAGRLRILVAEDDASVRRAIGRLLRIAGFDAVEFGSAEAVLTSDEVDATDCIVADIHLPGITGLALVDRLRRERERLPAVFVTAFDAPGLQGEALQHPNSAYLTKPFEGTDLLDAILRITAFCR